MGCFPACFGHLRSDLTSKKCLSQQESVKFLPEETASLKEEEIVDPIKLVSQLTEDISKEKDEVTVFDHSNIKKNSKSSSKSNLAECGNGKVEMEREDEREDQENSGHVVQEESCCSSLFTLSIDSRKQFLAAEMGEKEVSSLLRSEDPMVKQCYFNKSESGRDRACRGIGKDGDMAVEMSLSSWLAEKSPQNSPESENNYGEFSKLNSTSCCSGGDDQLGVGTVGRYWRQRGAAGEAEAGEVSSLGKC
ncbi:hypothetical protein AAHA92_26376 [Salvia divinorum]|uniref:Uncharacterized protein n=1 Tax=Salvia divinorum TaxID=28513 RepID=A0ABD1GET4_SALDI